MANFNPKENKDRSEGWIDELGRPSLPKRPKNIKPSNAYDQDLDARENKKHFLYDTDFKDNATEVRFDSSVNINPSHTSYDKFCNAKELRSLKASEESFDKDFVDDVPGEESVVPLASVEKGVSCLKSEEDIKLNSKTFDPEKDRKIITRSSTPDSSNFYDMNHFPRGKLIIINVKDFKKSSGVSEHPRIGTDKDALDLQQLFLDLGFIVERHDNPRTSEIKEVMDVAANEDYTNLGCFVCAFLSHGKEGVIYGTDGFLNINNLASLLCTKQLAGKPKILFFQACRGGKLMGSYNSEHIATTKANKYFLDLPVDNDFLFCYSTAQEYYAWRNRDEGSWFIQALVSVFRKFAHIKDIIRLMTLVNSFIVQKKSDTTDVVTRGKRQIGSFITHLRKEFFFFPPYGALHPEHCV